MRRAALAATVGVMSIQKRVCIITYNGLIWVAVLSYHETWNSSTFICIGGILSFQYMSNYNCRYMYF